MTVTDRRWLEAAARLAARGVPLSRPNPSVGAILVRDGIVVGRGWTQAGGRPHAEAVALQQAGERARGATLYVTLEPCAHVSARGPACADLVAASAPARVVIGCADPDPRTAGKGAERLREAGIAVTLANNAACEASLAGYLSVRRRGRPQVTLKLALSQDGALARPAGESQWITGEAARRHVHALRAQMDAILVGSGTLRADSPRLDVRLPGLEHRSPERWVLTSGPAPDGWRAIADPANLSAMLPAQYLMVEGGAHTARSFLRAGLVDRLAIYRAPLSIAGPVPRLPEMTADALADSSEWHRIDSRPLGSDTLDVYEAVPCSPE
ncbi:bifunctional diaminohydroxyphosphoribosylaminopyrimidine deaminase/5-amino-6-(5-phosphoribosylamino)uracil reductase RibD [Novosphingobium sp. TH158]|uniref:bifunctional diaminohydroxyphosphoribosylaminopyrimidine deaminase/5-amino-6-(5-phosphoribosylamino)uracil reductase RibD n=1 Tax=Novosphingobium sp. TH158 TaxID=2067455 RepID=UPI000C7E805C|nr:bifunctional diaminohydroxyphosphoribosylaminopyrimidine deaminase/5-amino-6-(5-phosphoribosylamino)uracil reductase RibD [Novosphingobium sp. TH158]PLK27840.1 bifunctional diaminohydroxyphosphoribosylaminopyrimidine deaminase/5-amino-6-(5-phosphoribosylamino)uracil reductase RibD [Novosphingobium sp. TH158]